MMNDDVMFGILNELQTLRCLKQIELDLAISNTKAMSVAELNKITDMIANPRKYFVKDRREENYIRRE